MTSRAPRLTTLGTAGVVLGGLLAVPLAAPASAAVTEVKSLSELRRAVAAANAREGLDTIVLGDDIRLTAASRGSDRDGPEAGDLDVRDDLRVDGQGFTLDGARVDRLFDVSRGALLVLDGIELTGGLTTGSGGAVRSAGTLRLLDSLVDGNVARGEGASGGGLFNDGGRLEVLSSIVGGNVATRAGGGIESRAGSTVVFESLLAENVTGRGPGNGGGLHLTGAGSVRVLDSEVLGNVAAAEGGGLWNSGAGAMLVQGTLVAGNRAEGAAADQGGGGLYNDGGSLRVSGGALVANGATGTSGSGGAVLSNAGTLVVQRVSVQGNSARRAGGGIEAVAGSTLVTGSRLQANRTGRAPGNGGALHLTGAGSVRVLSSRVIGNVAGSEGGGLWNSAMGRMLVERTIVSGNRAEGVAADQGGGGLYNDGGALRVASSDISGNGASGTAGSGGGVLNVGGSLTVTSTLLSGNSAKRAGGGIETAGGTVLLRASGLKSNRTGQGPGNGGGLHVTGAGAVTIDRGLVTGNAAANEGGGLWNSTTGTIVTFGVSVNGNRAPVGPNVYNDEPGGGTFLLNGLPVVPGPNDLST